jgi:hypothetical protein
MLVNVAASASSSAPSFSASSLLMKRRERITARRLVRAPPWGPVRGSTPKPASPCKRGERARARLRHAHVKPRE